MASNNPASSAWRTKAGRFKKFVEDIPSKKMSALYVRSQHGSGKSTTLPAYIASLFQRDEKLRDWCIIYLVSTPVQAQCLREYVLSDRFVPLVATEAPCFGELGPGRVCILSYEDFIQNSSAIVKLQVGMLFLLDDEITPTTPGLISTGIVVQWAHERKELPLGGAIIMLGVLPLSPTIKALASCVDRVSGIGIQDITPKLREGSLSERTEINRLMAQSAGTMVVGVHDSWGYRLHDDSGPAVDINNRNLLTLPMVLANPTQSVLINPEVPFSLHHPRLKTLVSFGVMEERAFVADIAQIVQRERDMTQAELDREMSWSWKSGLDATEVTYFPVYRADVDRSSIRPLGKAYGGSIFWTVLELIGAWPRTSFSAMPIPAIPDHRLVADVRRKLKLNRCIESDPEGSAYSKLTSLGFQALQLSRILPEDDFHRVHFLAGIMLNKATWSRNLLRVAIRLAAVMAAESTHVYKNANAGPLSSDHVRSLCSGPGRSQRYLGGLWVELGIWQSEKIRAEDLAVGGDKIVDGVHINLRGVRLISQEVAELEHRFGLQPSLDEAADTKLTDAEFEVLEEELTWSFIDQMAVFENPRHSRRPPYDVATRSAIRLSSVALLDARSVTGDEGFFNGFIAIYTTLTLMEEGHYETKCATIVPRRVLRKVEQVIGKPMIDALRSRYYDC